MSSHYVRQIIGGSGNQSFAAGAMVLNGSSNTISAAGTNALAGGSSNAVTASHGIALGAYNSAAHAGAVVLGTNSAAANTFASKGTNSLNARLYGALTMTGLNAPASVGLVAGAKATALITVTGVPTPGEIITVGAEVYTASLTPTPALGQFDVSGSTALVASSLLAAIAAFSGTVTAVAGPGPLDVTVSYNDPGVGGNAIALSTTAATITVPANFSGGTDGYAHTGLYIQGEEDATASSSNYFSLVKYDRWTDEDPVGGDLVSVLTPNYIAQNDTNWTSLGSIHVSLGIVPNNTAAALDMLAKGLSNILPAENLFVHVSAGTTGGSSNGGVAYNTGATDINGDEDILLGTNSFSNISTPWAAIIPTKGSLAIGSQTASQMSYANIGARTISVGTNNTAAGTHSVTFGSANSVASAASHGVAIGRGLSVSGASTGSMALGGSPSVAHAIAASNGAFLHVDGLATKTATTITSQDYVHKTQFFNGLIRGSGISATDDALTSSLTDTATDEGAREIFRPLHVNTIASLATATVDNIVAIGTSHLMALHGHVLITDGTEKVLFAVSDLLADSTGLLNSPTIALLHDATATWSPLDLVFSVSAGQLQVAVTNPSASAVKANLLFYLHDLFA